MVDCQVLTRLPPPHRQINKDNAMVEASRIMNLYQFIQLYGDMTSQAAGVLAAEGAAANNLTTEEASSAPPLPPDACQASMWMGRSAAKARAIDSFLIKFLRPKIPHSNSSLPRRVKELTDDEECCICMDGKADLILPCTHSFCQKCIDKWCAN